MFLLPRRQVLTGPPQGGVPELAPEWAGKVRKVIVNGVLPKGIVAGSTIGKQTTKFGTSLVQTSRIWNGDVGSQYAINLGPRPNSATFLIIAERNCDCNIQQNIPFIMNCATLGDGGVNIAMGNWWNSPVHRNKVHAGSGDLWIGGVFQSLIPSLSDNELLADTPYTIVNSISTMTGGEYKLFAKDDSTGGYVSPVKLHLFVELDLQSPESAKSLSANPWQIFKRPDSRIFVPVSVGGGTTTVTSDSAASYKVQGSVQSSSVAAYGIRSAIQSSAASGYNIRAAIQQDAPGSYRIRGLTQQSSTLAYGIRGLVDQAIAASYAVRGAVSSDASATYSILSATSVSASASAGYSIRGSIQQSSAASYSLRGSVTQDTSATYSIRGSINQDTAAIYALRGSVTQDTSAAYNILSASAVSSSVTAGYAIKGSVQSSIVAGYSIAQAVQAEIAASYIIRSGVVSEAQAAYVILGLVYQSIAASYVVDGGLFSGPIIPRLTRLSALTQRVDQLSIITRNVMLCSTIGAGE